MAVIQPLYFAGGRYSANVDRKLLAALLQSASDGTRLEGVIPANFGNNSLKVTADGSSTLTVSSGLCMIADAASQDVDTPGVYLAGVDTSVETVTLSTNGTGGDRYDLIYADVSETSYSITNRNYSSGNVTITTSAAHGFVAGQTVYVSGIDEFYDGAFVIASSPALTSTTFSYAKAGGTTPTSTSLLPTVQIGSTIVNVSKKKILTNVATLTVDADLTSFTTNSLIRVKGVDSIFDGDYHISATSNAGSVYTVSYKINRTPLSGVSEVTVSTSSAAKARVPFAIKVKEGSTTTEPSLPSGTNIKLAVIKILAANTSSNVSSGDVLDRRQFVTTVGGVHIYDSSVTALTYPTMPEGSLRYDSKSGAKKLEYYAGSVEGWKLVSNLALSGTGVATTAARSDHTHSGDTTYLGISQVLSSNYGGSGATMSVFPPASNSTILSASTTYLFEATIYTVYSVSPSNALSFDLQPSTNFASFDYDFVTWNQTESTSIKYSGHSSSNVDGSFVVATSATSGSIVINIKGVIVTDSSATTVTPALTLPVSGTINSYVGSFMKFNELGSSSVSVVRGTWSAS